MRDKAKAVGFKLEVEAPGKAVLSPAEMAELVEHAREQTERADAIVEGKDPDAEPITPTIRSRTPLHTILNALVQPDNVLYVTVDDSEVRFKVIKPTEMHFHAVQKDYKTGRKIKVTVQSGWDKDESVEARKPVVEKFLQQLTSEA